MESEFSSVFNKTSSGLWQRNGYMDKVEKNDIEMEEEEGEMVKWIQWTKIETKKREIERETDWELTQSGETPVLIRMGRSAASGHCVGGGSDDW